MKNVLLLADDCNPQWASLPIVGYNSAVEISRVANVTLVTSVRNRENIEAAGGVGNAKVVYIDNEYVAGPMFKLSKLIRGGDQLGWATGMAMNYLPYVAFELAVWRMFKRDLKAKKFDVVHRLTPMTPTIPSPLASLSPVPFVIGPLNGGLKWSQDYTNVLKDEKDWLTKFKAAYKFLPFHSSTFKRAAAILCAFKHTCDEVPRSCYDRVADMPEVGYDPSTFYARSDNPIYTNRPNTQGLQFLYASRLVPYKQPTLLVECFIREPSFRKHTLTIVGAGPEYDTLKDLIEKHSLQDNIKLVGALKQSQVASMMQTHDAFLFPSIRELGAGAIVEAMACGIPCIAVDYGAPGSLLSDGRGELVPMGNREQILQSFIQAMKAYVAEPYRRLEYATKASRYVQENLSWKMKAKQFAKVYESLTPSPTYT